MAQNKIKLADVASSTGTGAFVFATAPTIETSLTGNYLTASEIIITDASKRIVSAPVATYPSLTELTYLKGVTSAIQTQLNAKGTGDVTTVGTPIDGQIGIWTGDGTLEGDASLTFDTTDDTLVIAASGKLAFGAVDVLSDSAGSTTLQNIDALDATTEGTIETAIDTLANLTSIQGRTVTLADAGANAIFGWDDTAGAYENLTQAEARTVLGLGTAAYVATDLADLNEATIETAIDTLANLTSIQGRTVTLADAGADAVFGWDDSASAYQNLSAADTRTALGLATSDSPQFTGIELGHASDTTLTRSAAGVLAVEGVAIPSISSTNTLTNKRITKRTGTTTSSATPTINTDNVDFYSITAQTEAITSFTTNLSGTPTEAQTLWIAITGTASRAITWGASFEASTVALPTTTDSTSRLDVGFVWNTVTNKWRCIAVA